MPLRTLTYPGWYIPLRTLTYPGGVYTQVYPSLHTQVVYIPWCTPSQYTTLGTPPGIHRPAHYWVHCSTVTDVRVSIALGSSREYSLGRRQRGLSGPQECVTLLGDDAQSYSASPVEEWIKIG